MERIKFSLIVPVYNISNYIIECIDSILNQKYLNYEIIVINDGSTDDSEQKIRNINNEKIKIISKKNGGLSSARNEGIKHATGDYIWFVDGDDTIEENALNILNKYLENEKYDIVSFKYYKKYKTKKIILTDNIDITDIKQYPLINTSACTKIFKRDFYINNAFEFKEGKIYEDLELIPFIMIKTNSVGFIDEPLYTYSYRENSIMNTRKKFNINRDDKFWAISSLYNLFKKEKVLYKYKDELEYLTIKHLLLVYSTEILPFNANIYIKRCKKVLKYLEYINKRWYENKYLKKSSKITRWYVFLFRKKQFVLCKISLFFKKK